LVGSTPVGRIPVRRIGSTANPSSANAQFGEKNIPVRRIFQIDKSSQFGDGESHFGESHFDESHFGERKKLGIAAGKTSPSQKPAWPVGRLAGHGETSQPATKKPLFSL